MKNKNLGICLVLMFCASIFSSCSTNTRKIEVRRATLAGVSSEHIEVRRATLVEPGDEEMGTVSDGEVAHERSDEEYGDLLAKEEKEEEELPKKDDLEYLNRVIAPPQMDFSKLPYEDTLPPVAEKPKAQIQKDLVPVEPAPIVSKDDRKMFDAEDLHRLSSTFWDSGIIDPETLEKILVERATEKKSVATASTPTPQPQRKDLEKSKILNIITPTPAPTPNTNVSKKENEKKYGAWTWYDKSILILLLLGLAILLFFLGRYFWREKRRAHTAFEVHLRQKKSEGEKNAKRMVELEEEIEKGKKRAQRKARIQKIQNSSLVVLLGSLIPRTIRHFKRQAKLRKCARDVGAMRKKNLKNRPQGLPRYRKNEETAPTESSEGESGTVRFVNHPPLKALNYIPKEVLNKATNLMSLASVLEKMEYANYELGARDGTHSIAAFDLASEIRAISNSLDVGLKPITRHSPTKTAKHFQDLWAKVNKLPITDIDPTTGNEWLQRFVLDEIKRVRPDFQKNLPRLKADDQIEAAG